MKAVLLASAYVVAYVVLDWVSYIHPLGPIAVTVWNPPPGLSLALLLAYGLRFAPALFVASIAAELVVRGWPADPAISWLATLVVPLGYWATAALLTRRLGVDAPLDGVRDVSRFVAAALVAPLVVAIGYVGIHAAGHHIGTNTFLRGVFQFWIGDAIGILVTAPVLMRLLRWRPTWPSAWRTLEHALQAAAVVGAVALVFGLGGEQSARFFYLLFLPLIWVGLREGVGGASLALLAIQAGIVIAVHARGYDLGTLLELQILMMTIALTALFLGAVVSDRRRAQEDLAHSLRLAAAAETASSLAHELNQPLSAIGTYVRACSMMLEDPAANRALLAKTMGTVIDEVARAGDVVRRLRDFFRSGASQLQRVTVRGLVDGSVRSLGPRLMRHGVALDVDCAPDLPEVLVDALQIGTVLHNLAGNAIDAIVESDAAERRIVIRAESARGGVRITVIDSGPGLPADRAEDPFRPFATTKAQGMGVGLAISRAIVENHGGRLVPERRSAGAAFSFVLPVDGAEEAAA